MCRFSKIAKNNANVVFTTKRSQAKVYTVYFGINNINTNAVVRGIPTGSRQ